MVKRIYKEPWRWELISWLVLDAHPDHQKRYGLRGNICKYLFCLKSLPTLLFDFQKRNLPVTTQSYPVGGFKTGKFFAGRQFR
jgi:hypothetical protein